MNQMLEDIENYPVNPLLKRAHTFRRYHDVTGEPSDNIGDDLSDPDDELDCQLR